MAVEEEISQDERNTHRPGDKLRLAREAMHVDVEEIAARTRVPVRMLKSLEQGDYAALPGSPYCIGFSRAYARAVGLDEIQIARELRVELEAPDAFTGPPIKDIQPCAHAHLPPLYLYRTAF